jgi:predicted dehydrogenase
LPGVGYTPDDAAPKDLNWDFWLGPAQKIRYNPVRASPSFRNFWDYAGGTMTDWGTHHIGSVHHVMGQSRPGSVVATGGKVVIQDMFETPDALNVLWEYPAGWTLSYSLLQTNSYNPEGSNYGIVFHGSSGTLFLDRREVIEDSAWVEITDRGAS